MRPLAIGILLLWMGLAAGAEPLATEAFINAPTAEVWRVFTTSEGDEAGADLRSGGEIRSRYDPKEPPGDGEIIAACSIALQSNTGRSAHCAKKWSAVILAASGRAARTF